VASPSKDQTNVGWLLFASIMAVLGVAYYVESLIPGFANASSSITQATYTSVDIPFYLVFSALIVYYVLTVSKMLGLELTAIRLVLLAGVLWTGRWLFGIAISGIQGQPDAHVFNLAVFFALFLLSFRFRRGVLYAAIPVGFIYMTDMLIPGFPTLRLPLPGEWASGLTSLALLIFSLKALMSSRSHEVVTDRS
jgi:hypothetical protein